MLLSTLPDIPGGKAYTVLGLVTATAQEWGPGRPPKLDPLEDVTVELIAKAGALGAHAIIGVTLHIVQKGPTQPSTFIMLGTAIAFASQG